MKKFEIINNSLVVTDTVLNKVIFDNPKSDIYYSLSFLTLTPNKISIIDLSDKYNQTNVFECLLSEAVNSALVPFTIQTFTDFARQSLGFKTASGGSGAISDHTQLSNIGNNTHAQIDTHIGNKQNSLSVDGTGAKYPTVDAVNAGLISKQNTITGTTNFLPKITGAGTIGDSRVFDDGTNIGIGTDAPTHGIHLKGAPGNATRIRFEHDLFPEVTWIGNNGPNEFGISVNSHTFFQLSANTTRLSSPSNFLIGSQANNNIDKLQVDGSILGTAFKKLGDTNANILLAGGGVTPLILDQTAVANSTNAGRLRYYVSGAFSILECCMQTGATNYQWILISQQEIL